MIVQLGTQTLFQGEVKGSVMSTRSVRATRSVEGGQSKRGVGRRLSEQLALKTWYRRACTLPIFAN